MKKNILFAFVFILVCRLSVFSQTPCNSLRYQDSIFHQVQTTSGIYFGTATPYGLLAQPQDLYLDVYQPANDTLKKRPVIIFQFGGAFLIGTRNQPVIPSYATYFAQCGYVVASIDYRIGFDVLSTGSAERAVYRAVQDLRASVRFLCQHADQYGIDTNSIFLTGTSAGCIAALCSSFMTQSELPSTIHGILTEPGDLGGIDSSGNNDFGNRYVAPRGIISHWGAIMDTSFIMPNNPIPVLGIHGTADIIVPYDTGAPFGYPVFPVVYGDHPVTTRLTNIGIKNKLVPLVGYMHEPELLSPNICDTMNNEGREFLWSIIKPVTPPISGPTSICKQHIAQYSVPFNSGSKYCWQLMGNGTIVNNFGNAINVLWSDTGNVGVTVTQLNYMNAQADSVAFQTHVSESVSASFNYSADQLMATFINTSQYATTYNWSFGNGDTSSAFLPIEVYAYPGTYTVKLVVENGVCADTFSRNLTVDSCPVARFTYQVTNMNGIFYGDTTNTATYNWNFGDGNSANVNANHVFHQYANYGTYVVVLQVRNQFGCTSSDTSVIVVQNMAVNNVDANQISVTCDLQNGCELKFTQPGQWNLDVYDLLGRRLTTQQISGDYMLQISDFQSGIYLLKLYNNEQTLVTKFVKR